PATRPSSPPTTMPSETEATPSSSDARPPQTMRLSRSRPRASPPSRCPSVPGPWLTMAATFSLGSSSGSTGASSAASVTNASQAMASTPNHPSRPWRDHRPPVGVAAPVAASTGSRVAAGAPPGARVAAGSRSRPPSGAGMADPRVEDGVEHVHQEVDEHVAHRDDRHQALQGDVLAGDDRLVEQQADAGQREDHLDDDRTADERADVEAGDRQQRQARR